MKSKKIVALLLAGCMVMSIAACNANKRTDDDTDRTEESQTEETEDTKETEESTEKTEKSEESTTTTTTSEETEATQASRAAYTGKVLDFEDMHFFVNGKKYTLGTTTLQEMIDDGVPFKESDIKYASEKIKKNTQSFNGFGIELDKFWSPQVYVMNLSDSEKPMSECVIYRIYMPSIDDHYQNNANLSFDFPYDITMDELVANAGEPKEGDKDHYDGDDGYYTDTYNYKQKSEKYLGSREYSFEYKKGEISKIVISYIP